MIYYVSSTGQVIGGTAGSLSDDLRGVTHLPSGANYAIFVADSNVSSLNPKNLPGTYSFSGISPGPVYIVPTADGVLAFTEQSAADQLSASQRSQIANLRAGYAQTIAGGFQATIAGTTHTFGWSTDDKANLNATQTAVAQSYLSYPIQYSDINGSPVTLSSATDLDTIEQTATKFFSAQHQQILNLIGQVQAQTSVPTTPVTWSPATY